MYKDPCSVVEIVNVQWITCFPGGSGADLIIFYLTFGTVVAASEIRSCTATAPLQRPA